MRRACRVVALSAVATFAIPGPAFAADPPVILSAGIDAADRPYVTWRVGAGTTYDHAEFATAPTADPDVPDSFVEANVVAIGCTDAPEVCAGTPQSTSLTVDYPVARDRRYFVKVTATVDGTPRHLVVSAVWVIDEAKPLVAGQPPQVADGPPTDAPAAGALLAGSLPLALPPSTRQPPVPPPPPGAGGSQPGAALSLLALPRTISALQRRGVRLRVTCSQAPCTTTAALRLGRVTLVSRRVQLLRAGTQTVVLKPTAAARRRLRGRARARLRVNAAVTPQRGATRRLSRFFVVQRRIAAKG
jgi:hypothetical protein